MMQLYDIIEKISNILTPETNDFYTYVVHTSDDDGLFLRTCYCWKNICLKDKTIKETIDKVMVTSSDLIDLDELKEAIHNKKSTVQMQIHHRKIIDFFYEAQCDVDLGYKYIYIFNLVKNSYQIYEGDIIQMYKGNIDEMYVLVNECN